jgi:RimJ/RimL family protein N-acetyltransferase
MQETTTIPQTSWETLSQARLENEHVLLRPIEANDAEQFRAIAFDADIWKYFVSRITSEEEFGQFMKSAIEDTAAGRRIAFAVISKARNCIAGSMSYGNLARQERRLEIGWSWLGKEFRGAGLNRWAKYLLLEHAFGPLQCERVEFKTDVLNLQAKKGLENIGATFEGVFRSYNYMPDNRRRDAAYYSIIRTEWPRIEAALQAHPKVF